VSSPVDDVLSETLSTWWPASWLVFILTSSLFANVSRQPEKPKRWFASLSPTNCLPVSTLKLERSGSNSRKQHCWRSLAKLHRRRTRGKAENAQRFPRQLAAGFSMSGHLTIQTVARLPRDDKKGRVVAGKGRLLDERAVAEPRHSSDQIWTTLQPSLRDWSSIANPTPGLTSWAKFSRPFGTERGRPSYLSLIQIVESQTVNRNTV
jgi:hypothetical protein